MGLLSSQPENTSSWGHTRPAPKPTKRVKDKKSVKATKKDYCEYVDEVTGIRCGKRCYREPHHVESVGSGGPDIEENQIQLCDECHTKAHTACRGYSKKWLYTIISRRMMKSLEEIINAVEKAMGRGIALWKQGVNRR